MASQSFGAMMALNRADVLADAFAALVIVAGTGGESVVIEVNHVQHAGV